MVASKNSALEVRTRTIEGAYLDLQITEFGKVIWLRIASYAKQNMSQAEYNVFKLTGIKPMHSLYRRIYMSNQNGLIFKMSTEGQISITPFGSEISEGTGVNLSEIYITSD